MTASQLLTYAEAAEQLRWGRQQVARAARAGLLPRVILAPKVHRIRQSDLDAFIESRTEVAS